MLKNVPKSLLVKIRQTQAAKAGQHDSEFVAVSVKVPKTFWAGQTYPERLHHQKYVDGRCSEENSNQLSRRIDGQRDRGTCELLPKEEVPKWVTFCEMYIRMAREWRSESRGIFYK
jgi:hypothetical protein